MQTLKNPLFSILLFTLFGHSAIQGEIIDTADITIVNSVAQRGTITLFNITNVLLDTDTMLGKPSWRRYVRERLSSHEHDLLTLLVAKNMPPKAVEPVTAQIIRDLQDRGHLIFGVTARGRDQWYSTDVKGIDKLTEDLLSQVGIDFRRTKLPIKLGKLSGFFDKHYHSGIIYTTSEFDTGTLLQKVFIMTGYTPGRILLIDDKRDSVESAERAMRDMFVPFVGIAYHRTQLEEVNFDPMLAHIQLNALLFEGKVLSDEEAEKVRGEAFITIDAESYFWQIIERCDFDQLEASLLQ